MPEAIAASEIQLIIDMVSVALINSKGLETLFDQRQKLVKNGGWLKVTNAKPVVRAIRAYPVANSADGFGAKLLDPSVGWPPSGPNGPYVTPRTNSFSPPANRNLPSTRGSARAGAG